MGDYEQLKELDVITPILPEIMEGGRFALCTDGKFRPTSNLLTTIHIDSPWINVRVCPDRNCFLWHHIYFNIYGIISRNCFNCWKVVFRPKTLDELIAVYNQQLEDEDKPNCKSGIERREASGWKGAYACFWYAPFACGVDEARKFHKSIERKIHRLLGVDKKVILKRACTEMEDAAGPSEKWYYPPGQNIYEDLLDNAWSEIGIPDQDLTPQILRNAIMLRWIGWAVKNRDKTAEKYYDSMASFGVVPTTTYHDKMVERVSEPLSGDAWREKNGIKIS